MRATDLGKLGADVTSASQYDAACDVGTIEKAGGDTWGRWCACKFGADPYLGTNVNYLDRCNLKYDGPLANPSYLFAPWTEVGGAARGLPRQTTVIASIVGATSVTPDQVTPLALWYELWANPAEYARRVAVQGLFGGPWGIIRDIASTPVTLLASGFAQCAAEKKDPTEYIAKPFIQFAPDNAAWLWGTITSGISGKYATLAGLQLQRAGRGYVADGTYKQMVDPNQRALTVFFAQSGAALGDAVQNIIDSQGRLDQKQDIWNMLSNILAKVARSADFGDDIRGPADLLSMVFKVVNIIVTKFLSSDTDAAHFDFSGKGFASLADDLIGVLTTCNLCRPPKPGTYGLGIAIYNMASGVVTESKDFAAAVSNGDLKLASTRISDLNDAIQKLMATMDVLGKKFGGDDPNSVVNRLIHDFNATVDLFANPSKSLSEKILAAQQVHGAQVVKSKAGLRDSGKGIAAGLRSGRVVLDDSTPAPAPLSTAQQGSGSVAPLLIAGAGTGALVGGPPGALLGAGAGLLLALMNKKKS